MIGGHAIVVDTTQTIAWNGEILAHVPFHIANAGSRGKRRNTTGIVISAILPKMMPIGGIASMVEVEVEKDDVKGNVDRAADAEMTTHLVGGLDDQATIVTTKDTRVLNHTEIHLHEEEEVLIDSGTQRKPERSRLPLPLSKHIEEGMMCWPRVTKSHHQLRIVLQKAVVVVVEEKKRKKTHQFLRDLANGNENQNDVDTGRGEVEVGVLVMTPVTSTKTAAAVGERVTDGEVIVPSTHKIHPMTRRDTVDDIPIGIGRIARNIIGLPPPAMRT